MILSVRRLSIGVSTEKNGNICLFCLPKSIAQIPDPVPTSKARCAFLPIGAIASLLSKVIRNIWCCRSVGPWVTFFYFLHSTTQSYLPSLSFSGLQKLVAVWSQIVVSYFIIWKGVFFRAMSELVFKTLPSRTYCLPWNHDMSCHFPLGIEGHLSSPRMSSCEHSAIVSKLIIFSMCNKRKTNIPSGRISFVIILYIPWGVS